MTSTHTEEEIQAAVDLLKDLTAEMEFNEALNMAANEHGISRAQIEQAYIRDYEASAI